MKKMFLVFFITSVFCLMAGCMSPGNAPTIDDGSKNGTPHYSSEERKRMDLYIAVMKEAFEEENGGNAFVAVKLDTLQGLSDAAKKAVLQELGSLSANVYSFEDVKNDSTKFELDEKGRLIRTIDGSLLWVEVEEYNNSDAIITGVSWFGNLGAVFSKFEATYDNGKWQLKLISMAVS